MKKKSKELPDFLYVYKIKEDDENYFCAGEDFGDIDDGEMVGVYALAETKRMRVVIERTLE